jgi:hypothetical protein
VGSRFGIRYSTSFSLRFEHMISCCRNVEGKVSANTGTREVILRGKCRADLFDGAGVGGRRNVAEMVGSRGLGEDLLDFLQPESWLRTVGHLMAAERSRWVRAAQAISLW